VIGCKQAFAASLSQVRSSIAASKQNRQSPTATKSVAPAAKLDQLPPQNPFTGTKTKITFTDSQTKHSKEVDELK